MQRRLLVTALAGWTATRLLAQTDAPRPHHRIPAAQLLEALSARFPLRLATPLLQLELGEPALLLLTTRNRIGTALQLQAAGPALRHAVHGELDLLFRLRYEPADRSIRARDPELQELRVPGLARDAADAIGSLARALLASNPGEVVVHRFTQRELALPDTMGFEPGELTVRDDGVEIEFQPKVQR